MNDRVLYRTDLWMDLIKAFDSKLFQCLKFLSLDNLILAQTSLICRRSNLLKQTLVYIKSFINSQKMIWSKQEEIFLFSETMFKIDFYTFSSTLVPVFSTVSPIVLYIFLSIKTIKNIT